MQEVSQWKQSEILSNAQNWISLYFEANFQKEQNQKSIKSSTGPYFSTDKVDSTGNAVQFASFTIHPSILSFP